MNLEHETSITHLNKLNSGLTITWVKTDFNETENSILKYSDDSFWFFDNGSAEQLTYIGELKTEIDHPTVLESTIGVFILTQCGFVFVLHEDFDRNELN